MFIDSLQFYCGVVVHCGEDCGSSDLTEPCSPLSTTSLEEMPPTQSQPAWLWEAPPGKRPKQGKITQYFKTKSKVNGGTEKVQDLISHLLSSEYEPGLPTPPTTSPESDTSSIGVVENGDVSLLFTRPEGAEEGEQEERTIRFPAQSGNWAGHFVSDILCKWTDCEAKFSTTTALIEHLQIKHVNTQTMNFQNYVCKWVNCKVFGRNSCSRTWLERHVLSHGGNKPFRCIVDSCGQRFSNQTTLQRHVNSHFSESRNQGASKKNCESSNKLIRRNGKKLRIRSQPFSARIYDFFDTGIMEGLQHNLIDMTERRTNSLFDEVPGDTVTLHSKILGRRVDGDGQVQILLRWFPSDILNDEWVDPSKVDRVRHIHIPSLPSKSKDCLDAYLFANQRVRKTHGRKTRPHLATPTHAST